MTGDSLTTRATHIWAVALTGASLFMITLDNLIVLSTLPSMQRELGVSIDRLQWVVDAYILSFAVLMLTGAALGDRYGRRRMLAVGLLLFTASSAAGALSNDLTQLVVARAVQGVGAALLMPMTLTLLSAAFPPERRTFALGLWSSIAGLGVALGPLLGGVIVETLDWHWIFWINVPVGLAAAALAPRRLTREPRRASTARPAGPGARERRPARHRVGHYPRQRGRLGLAFDARRLRARRRPAGRVRAQERRSAAPMLPLGLFRRPGFAAANGAGFGLHFTMFAAFFLDHPVPHAGARRFRPQGRRRDAAVDAPAARRLAVHRRARRPHRQPAAVVDGLAAALRGDCGRGPRDGRRRELRRRSWPRSSQSGSGSRWCCRTSPPRHSDRPCPSTSARPPAPTARSDSSVRRVRNRRRGARVRPRWLLRARPAPSSTGRARRCSSRLRSASSAPRRHSGSRRAPASRPCHAAGSRRALR